MTDIAITNPLEESIIATLKEIYDPEIPVNIYDLGLIYNILIDDEKNVIIQMTLTAPGCPVAQTFPLQIADAVRAVPDVNEVKIDMVWDPPWTVDRMTEAAKLQLGFFS